MSEERLVKAGLPIDLDPFLIPDGTKAFDDKKGSLNFNKGFLAVSSLAIAIPLGGCTIAQEQTPTPVQNESVSITQVIEQQKKEGIGFSAYDITAQRKTTEQIENLKNNPEYGELKSSILLVSVNPNDGSTIQTELMSFAKQMGVAFFDDNNQPLSYNKMVAVNVSIDPNGNLQKGLMVEVVKENGEKETTPFLILTANINQSSLDPSIIEKLKAGDKKTIKQLSQMFDDPKNIQSLDHINPFTQKINHIEITQSTKDNPITKALNALNPFAATPVSAQAEEQITPTPTPTETTTPTETAIPQPSLESLGLTAEIQQMFDRQGWQIKWDSQNARYTISQLAFDEATQNFTDETTHEIGWIDTEGNLHINIIHPSYQKIAENKYQDTSNPQELIVNLKNLSTPTPEAGQETQKPGFELLSTDNPNPLFQKTGGILVFRYLDENGVLRTATFSQKEAAFVDFDLSTASENLFVWTSEPEVLQTEFSVTHIPWELLHDPSLPITARLIAEGFDRDFPEETKAALMGYILRFERADDGSKVCFLRPALRDQIPDPKNPQKTIKFEVTDEFVDDAVRWAARKDKYGNWERLFFTTIDPEGNKILFTYMQLLDINGNRLLQPLAIGVNIPDEKMAYFIKDWNTSEDRTPGGNFNSSFFRIIIATEGDYFKELSPGHILYRMMGPKSRDPLDSLLAREGKKLPNIKYANGSYTLGIIFGEFDYMKQNNLNLDEIIIGDEKGPSEIPQELQQLLFGLGF